MENQNKNYKRINLRDFRHGLTQLKDSINAGQIYQVEEKSKVLGYFVPAKYEFEVKRRKLTPEELEKFRDAAMALRGAFKIDVPEGKDYTDIYADMMRKKYFKK